MKKWQVVRRMTPKQKGEILERLGDGYKLHKAGMYHVFKVGGGQSDYILRRCPECGHIDIWHIRPPLHVQVACGECGKCSITT